MNRELKRRTVVVGTASSLVGFAVGPACDGSDSDGDGSGGGTSGGASTGNAETRGQSDAGSSGDPTIGTTGGNGSSGAQSSSDGADSSSGAATESGESDSTGAGACERGEWLAGGVASMAGDYPDPFEDRAEPGCTIVGSQGCGPCWTPGPSRVDISAGVVGLPMQLWIRLLWEGSCDPVEGAVVDVWFSNIDGVYSGQTPSQICNNGDGGAAALDFLRGQQASDAAGKLHFDAVYPGWYPGRTPHIHALVIVGGVNHYVTQLYFADDLSDSIYADHPDYDHRPVRDTPNAQDGGFDPGAPNYIDTRATYDCAMQAWATLFVPVAAQGVGC